MDFKSGETSMSDWMLYHVWGIRGYRMAAIEKLNPQMTLVTLEPLPSVYRCPRCGTKNVIRKGTKSRLLRGTPVGRCQMLLEAAIPRVHCERCGITRQVRVPFAEEKHRHTRQFERYALELARITTTQHAAEHLGVAWGTVRDIEVRHLNRKYKKPKLKHLRYIAIDEIYLGKRMKFVTLVLDLETGAIVYVGHGKSAESLDPFWKRLRGSEARIEAVAADMSHAYALAVHENLPDAALVNDRFHVIKKYNEMLTELRRELHREATTKLQKKALKGTRWLLLKRIDNLDDRRREPQRLLQALKLNESLATAYYMKDDLNQFWEQPTKLAASWFLNSWITDAQSSGIALLMKFAKTLAAHRRSLLAWYDHPISTGPLEGTNNKIKTLTRQAYGYRDFEFFRLKLFALHNSRYALLG
jgi:transposase